jgi:polyferredoxin
VYTEIFLWIERQVEGNRVARMRLDAGPLSLAKFGRKTAKHFIWIAFAFWTGFTFVGYFSSIRELGAELVSLHMSSWEVFWVFFYGFATYGNAGFLREQVCKYMCPYARFQSAKFDKDTLIISYDAERGEPRGTRARSADLQAAKLGHCIDCELCVQVCPTGIDIRKGLQYECIGCAACIDVCNGVFRPRVVLYSAILVAIALAFVASLALRIPFKVDVVRDRGALARVVEDGRVENVYRLQLMNASERPQRYRIEVAGLAGVQRVGAGEVEVGAAESRWVPVAVQLPHEAARAAGPGAHAIEFHITQSEGTWDRRERSTFVVPR